MLWLLSVLCCAGCEILTDVDVQCAQSVDCERAFGAGHECGADGFCRASVAASPVTAAAPLPPEWSCLERPAAAPPDMPRAMVRAVLDVYDYASARGLKGIGMIACMKTDPACANPTVSRVASDESGAMEFSVPYGFDGHFELTGEPQLPLLLSDLPWTETRTVAAPMLTPAVLSATAVAGGDRYDEERGFVLLAIHDCDGDPAAGVRVEASAAPGNAAFYFDSALPSRDLGSTRVAVLGRHGEARAMAGFINVTPGFPTFSVSLAQDGRSLGVITVQVRPGAMTMARFQPGYP